jgi:hypothetical protein
MRGVQVARLAMKLPTGDMGLMGRTVDSLMGGRNPDAPEPTDDEELL